MMKNEQPLASRNSIDAVFLFTEDNLRKAEKEIAKYPPGRQAAATMALLDLAQRQIGWLPRSAMSYVANLLGIPPIRVYEVATFYTMYRLYPVGQHHIKICTNISCWLRGSEEIVRSCQDTLGLKKLGETTQDGQFTIDEVECLGACVNAPVVQIGDDYFEDLDYVSMRTLIEMIQKGSQPQKGSQIGRQCSCPISGPTTLKPAHIETREM